MLQAILENLTEGIIVFRPDGTVALINGAAQEMYGIKADVPDGITVRSFLETCEVGTAESFPIALDLRPCTRAMRGERFLIDQIRFKETKSGREWIAKCASIPVYGEDGQLLFGVLSLQDVTLEHGNAEKIRNANSVLQALSAQLLRLQDDERKRIARELHDGTVQVLSGALINLTLLSQSGEVAKLPAESSLLSKSLALVASSATELRTMSYLLHPPVLDELGLVPALRTWVEGFSERTGISVDMSLAESGHRLAAEVEATLFRITQEALANVHRHAKTSRATVRLAISKTGLTLTISDKGGGFDASRIFSGGKTVRLGIGLPGMRERARLLGGTFEIESSDRGTKVRVTLP
jgi:PAS domain S-box-containing protein